MTRNYVIVCECADGTPAVYGPTTGRGVERLHDVLSAMPRVKRASIVLLRSPGDLRAELAATA